MFKFWLEKKWFQLVTTQHLVLIFHSKTPINDFLVLLKTLNLSINTL